MLVLPFSFYSPVVSFSLARTYILVRSRSLSRHRSSSPASIYIHNDEVRATAVPPSTHHRLSYNQPSSYPAIQTTNQPARPATPTNQLRRSLRRTEARSFASALDSAPVTTATASPALVIVAVTAINAIPIRFARLGTETRITLQIVSFSRSCGRV